MKMICMFLLLMLCGCAIFKRTTTTTDETGAATNQQTKIKTNAETESTKSKQYLRFVKDSVNSAYRIQFLP